MEKKMTKRQVLSPKEAAEYLGVVSEITLERWRRLYRNTGELKGPLFLDIEGKVGYRIDDLEIYLNKKIVRRDSVA